MDENEERNSNIRTIIIVAGVVTAIIIFFITWRVISSGYFTEPDHKIEFNLHNENTDPNHVFFIEWENQTYGFEGNKNWYTFDIDHDRSYFFGFHLKNLTNGELYNLRAKVNVTEEDGLLLDIIVNDLGSYSIYSDMDSENVDELSILFKDFDYEIVLSIKEYSDVV